MGMLTNKRGLIMGVANERSIAWGIAKALHEAGAELAFTYQGEALQRRVEPLAESIGNDFLSGSWVCLLYTSPSPRDRQKTPMPTSA